MKADTMVNSKYEKYPAYKDSGVEWLGKIPEGWEVKKLKYLGTIYAGISGKKGDDFSKEFKFGMKPFVPFTNICNNLIISDDDFQYVNIKEYEKQNVVEKNDIMFLMSSETLEDIAKCSLYLGALKELYLNSFCKGFRLNSNKSLPLFINYLYTCICYRNYFSLVGRGFTRINLKQEFINNSYALLPPLPEQTRIAEFLDSKTVLIDKAIALKEKQIVLLKERKQIIIQNAVTKGINPNVKLKDSGVEWIGEIPEHWEIKRLRYLGKTQNGISAGAEYFGKGYPFVSYSDVYKNIELPNKFSALANSSEEDRKTYSVKEGDVFFTRTSETIEEIGLTSVCFEDVKNATFAGFLIRYRPNNTSLFKGFSKYYFSCNIHRSFFVKEMTLVTRASLSQSLLKTLPVLLPPIEEQMEIYEFLEKKLSKINKAIDQQQKQIEKLKEYKTVLIDSSVTGKIKV